MLKVSSIFDTIHVSIIRTSHLLIPVRYEYLTVFVFAQYLGDIVIVSF